MVINKCGLGEKLSEPRSVSFWVPLEEGDMSVVVFRGKRDPLPTSVIVQCYADRQRITGKSAKSQTLSDSQPAAQLLWQTDAFSDSVELAPHYDAHGCMTNLERDGRELFARKGHLPELRHPKHVLVDTRHGQQEAAEWRCLPHLTKAEQISMVWYGMILGKKRSKSLRQARANWSIACR